MVAREALGLTVELTYTLLSKVFSAMFNKLEKLLNTGEERWTSLRVVVTVWKKNVDLLRLFLARRNQLQAVNGLSFLI